MSPLAIALDLGGTQLRGALVDAEANILRHAVVATDAAAGPAVVLQQLCAIASAVSEEIAEDRVLGVGVVLPGPLDTVNGVALAVPTLAGFVDLPIRTMLEQQWSLPVQLENDAIAATLGEWRFGAGRGHADLVYVTVSTGIGGGVVSDGRLLRGRRGMAGHVGHMTIMRDGEACACGNRGCWEAYGSGTAFAQRARVRAAGQATGLLPAEGACVDGRSVFEAAAKGDPLAIELVSEEADILGVGIANLLHLYSPDLVVIGGGMSANFDMLHPGIVARLRVAAMPPFREVPVVRAALNGYSGLLGAAALAFDAAGVAMTAPTLPART
jgi:glucokinase